MNTITTNTDDCNSLRAEIEATLIADGITSERQRNSIIEQVVAGLERDREKAEVTEQLDSTPPAPDVAITPGRKRINAEMRDMARRESEQQDAQERRDNLRKLQRDIWIPTNESDRKRFASLGIRVSEQVNSPIYGVLFTEDVPKRKWHDMTIALMFHIAKYGLAIGKVSGETPIESLANSIYKHVRPIAVFKDSEEVERLARWVAGDFLEKFERHSRDDNAARRGGLISGRVRRDRAEERTWKQVIELKESGMKIADIVRQTGVSRSQVNRILKAGIRFNGKRAKFK